MSLYHIQDRCFLFFFIHTESKVGICAVRVMKEDREYAAKQTQFIHANTSALDAEVL